MPKNPHVPAASIWDLVAEARRQIRRAEEEHKQGDDKMAEYRLKMGINGFIEIMNMVNTDD